MDSCLSVKGIILKSATKLCQEESLFVIELCFLPILSETSKRNKNERYPTVREEICVWEGGVAWKKKNTKKKNTHNFTLTTKKGMGGIHSLNISSISVILHDI